MRWMSRGWMLVGVVLVALCAGAGAQVATTTVADTVYRADGGVASGTVLVSWPAFTTATGISVPGGSTSATIAAGVLSVQLAPNAGSMPMGSYYTAVYHLDDGTVSREYWVVPVSTAAVHLSAIRSTVLPTSVAMQTVSKAYVDTAIAAAVTGHPLDSSTPYVLKSGDTMTGPLALAGDPTSSTQAADKHYVDVNVAGVASGLAQKVSMLPSTTQTVAQPVGTTLQVNALNGVEYASQYVSGRGDNGIGNAVNSADCASGCTVVAEQNYPSIEGYLAAGWSDQTHVEDLRRGQRRDTYLNPENVLAPGTEAGQVIDVTSTRSGAQVHQQTTTETPASVGLQINHTALAGGSNQLPEQVGAVPYFKSGYSALMLSGVYNTQGQHVLAPTDLRCYGVGDCLIGSQFLLASGGFRDSADEGGHPMDIQIREDPQVFVGVCATGCTTGATALKVTASAAPGTQGDGRFLIDKNPAKVLSSGVVTGGGAAGPHSSAAFTGTNFPLSVFFQTAQSLPSQAHDIAPGTVTFAIATSGVATGFATNTAAAPQTSGVACVVDATNSTAPNDYEMAAYTVVDGSHLRMTLNKAHAVPATVAMGGLCGYGLEQVVDTAAGIRQVFPVVGSYSATGLYYAGGTTPIVGQMGQTTAFVNVSLAIASVARSGNVVTLTTAGNFPADLGGLTMTVAGVADSSYNGSFAVATTGPHTLTYVQTGANSTSSGGTLTKLTGDYALYPMAEVLSVYNAVTKSVDGQMTLAPNTVAWAANDVVEQPHYYQEAVGPDVEYIAQTTPRPSSFQRAGIQYEGNNGPGLQGWSVTNATPAAAYFGNGGTHFAPDLAIQAKGVWQRTMVLDAGEQSVFTIHCNSHGCGKWNSAYNLFELDSNVGTDTMSFAPTTSALTLGLRGAQYSFTPQAFTAGTINVNTLNATTLNATTINGSVSAGQLPVFGGSGGGHSVGAVPDPGATAGTTRFLREDGSWTTPPAGSGGSSTTSGGGLVAGATADYSFLQGSGIVLTDATANANNGTLASGSNAPVWTSTGLQFSTQQGVALPAALNGTQTFVMAVYINPVGVAGQPSNNYPVLISSSNGGTGFNYMYEATTLDGNGLIQQAYAPRLYVNGGLTSAAANLMSGFHVLAVTLGTGSGAVDHLYMDGTEVATYIRQGVSAGQQTSGNLYFGSSNVGPWSGSGFNGTAYRLRTYATQLSAGDVQTVSAVIRNEVAARGVAVSPQPIVAATPQLHAIGDSITQGAGASSPWPQLLSLTNQPAYTVTNWGIYGVLLQELNGSEPNRVGRRCLTTSGPAIAVVFAGTNDVYNGFSATDTFGALASEIQTLKQGGCKVFVGTMISRPGVDAVKNTYDALILGKAKQVGADAVVDFAANPLLGADGANTGTTYFTADHIHPTQAGQQLLANALSNVLNYTFGYNELNEHTMTTLPYSMTAGDGAMNLAGVTGAGTLTLPDCTGQSGAVYRIHNPQSTYAVMVAPLNGSQLINGLALGTTVTVPANGTLTLRDVPNAKTVSGCHWEM